MKLAVLSDIHANMEAFEAVLKDIHKSTVDAVISLGDNIGYGPEPEKVIQCIRNLHIPSVIGNHEDAVLHRELMNSFNINARISIIKTIDMLSENTISYIAKLPRYLISNHCRFVHGAPPDSPRTYMYEILGLNGGQIFSYFNEPICFMGHTHILDWVDFDGKAAIRKPLYRGKIHLEKNHQYAINVGSVGQPRDGDNHAKYIIWDTSDHTIDVRFIGYDITAVADKIRAAGLPLANATRLW